jgi:hypothetical protein
LSQQDKESYGSGASRFFKGQEKLRKRCIAPEKAVFFFKGQRIYNSNTPRFLQVCLRVPYQGKMLSLNEISRYYGN